MQRREQDNADLRAALRYADSDHRIYTLGFANLIATWPQVAWAMLVGDWHEFEGLRDVLPEQQRAEK
jgi:hypothetical protein